MARALRHGCPAIACYRYQAYIPDRDRRCRTPSNGPAVRHVHRGSVDLSYKFG
ncbi:hypothetical protein AZA_82496 [Nitrospirillum viridazoti Y2]|nr:hypothetical protein AZA_82496 [Nitrospirillum amazonense Y2]